LNAIFCTTELIILVHWVASFFLSFFQLHMEYSSGKTANCGSFSWSEFTLSWIQVTCAVAQENGRRSTGRGQKMFMNSQSVRIAMVCSFLALPIPDACGSAIVVYEHLQFDNTDYYSLISFRRTSIQNPPVSSCYFENTLHHLSIYIFEYFGNFCMSICFQVLIMLLINTIRPREAGLPSLSWNGAAEQQGTPPATRSQAVA